jgi:hypothetical protein
MVVVQIEWLPFDEHRHAGGCIIRIAGARESHAGSAFFVSLPGPAVRHLLAGAFHAVNKSDLQCFPPIFCRDGANTCGRVCAVVRLCSSGNSR